VSLKKWFKEEWVDISRPKKGGGFEKCGRSKSGKKKYPKCLPKAKAAGLTEKQRKSAVRRKRAASNSGGKPTNVSTFVKRKKRGSKKKK
jgi:hypothetical protein|tara:strand:+ start:303 stop:569 length:267 start_codon:yes stop_codon:yes gene_type:complete